MVGIQLLYLKVTCQGTRKQTIRLRSLRFLERSDKPQDQLNEETIKLTQALVLVNLMITITRQRERILKLDCLEMFQ